ncbi:Protein kinase, catalytic domain-containing protein [Artemisia annua]|uniref:non-specific serine/threonine protein kinase n=1 Tax=Artemisia annua TaxID=35608 RepID=A0A2U1PBY4_ARTAN|nr:Protein kinase, catalytic domain-containing protein [Artemisia annua]
MHDPTCGHPGFELQCNSNGSAVFNMSQNEYKVKDIVYKEKKVRLQNTALLTKSSQKCENLDIRNLTTDFRFSIDKQTTQNLVLMSNCSDNFSSGLDTYRIGTCENNTIEYVMLENDTNMRNMTGKCGVVVEAPVEAGGGPTQGVANLMHHHRRNYKPDKILCLDPYYNRCLPKDCGDGLNISYPFAIRTLHDPICGYPGFVVHCNSNGSAVFNMSQNEYKVKDIVYKEKKVRLQNTALLTKNSQNCENLDIRNFTTDWRLSINNHTTQNLVLMSNCSGNTSSGLVPGMDIYRVGSTRSCEKDTIKYAMLKNDTNLRNMTGRCSVVVETPVETGGGEGWRVNGTNYGEVMEQGFELTWRAPDCGECETSGGTCGFNATALRFVCFCTDRPHARFLRPNISPSPTYKPNRGSILKPIGDRRSSPPSLYVNFEIIVLPMWDWDKSDGIGVFLGYLCRIL